MTDSENRRGADRVERESHVLYREYVLSADKPDYAEGLVSDISGEGLSFISPHEYQVGDVLEVRLMLIGWDKYKNEFYHGDPRKATDPLVALLEVANIAPSDGAYKIGGRYSSIDESHRAALQRYLEKFQEG